ncbi:iron-sulfur oxidoreductase subunit beta [Streptomyces bingchenggensis BCW-1]|uniref:Iron-sulfur oxidoreductase subunit beta n=2 Tax=Streptomyces TaxID=1883 RepID=D7CFA8_STRBB|nr:MULTISPECIES: PDR/VanB family oxidoreductase [Streptomyces]ADI13124.1 iron-sulfur oxidoreductase subunit beta [Streptomyces bingchenggensis BCW-1]
MSNPSTPDGERSLVVAERVESADDVASLILRHPGGELLPEWQPGAHIDLLLDDGLVRHYSLCGDPDDRSSWRIGVLRVPDSRGGSAYVHGKLHPGTPVRVRGPRNNFALQRADRYLFVAGGIGITPLLPMIAAAETAGAEWRLLYGGRTRSSMAFLDELAAYGEAVTVHPQDQHGLLDLDGYLGEPDTGTLVYCCGPEPLLAAAEERCGAWPEGALRVERFQAKEQEETAAGARAFEVVLSRSGHTLHVPPGKTVLEAVQEAGVSVPYSCAEGICGTCETEVLTGEPDHRDSVLSAEERESGETMMICVSRSRGPQLVLDL